MTVKKEIVFPIAVAMVAYGAIALLESLGVFTPFRAWWLPVILLVVGLLALLKRKMSTRVLGWICFLYGAALLLMTAGVFHWSLLWRLFPATWVLFGLLLLL